MLTLRKLNRLYYVMLVCFAVMIVAATFIPLGNWPQVSHAQNISGTRIVSFGADLESVTPDEAESGEKLTTLTWETEGLSDGDSLKLEVFVLREWHEALEAETELEPSDSLEVTVPHTLDFQEPTWRLSIIREDMVDPLDSQELRLPYVVDEDIEPEIVEFESAVDSVDINDLYQGLAQVPVTWEVVNRVPNSNLHFVQVYRVGGQLGSTNVELPRDVEWIRSKDDGMVAPILPPDAVVATPIVIRLQVVDRDDPTIIYTFEDIPLAVEGVLRPTPQPRATRQPVVRNNTPTPNTTDVVTSGEESCNADFFFEEPGREYVLNGGGALNWGVFDLCPTSSIQFTSAVFQMYENGFMVWRSSEPSQVYIFTNDGLGIGIESRYTGGDVVITETPPSGITILPDGVLGEAWNRRRDLSRSVGWPVGPAEEYEMTYQETVGSEIEGLVMTMPTGGRFFLRYDIPGQRPITWAWVNATN